MPLEGPRCIRDRRDARTYSPVIPRCKIAASDRLTTILPEVAKAFFDRPCAANGAKLFTEGRQSAAFFRLHVLGIAQPGVLCSLEVGGAIFAQFANVATTRQVNGFCQIC